MAGPVFQKEGQREKILRLSRESHNRCNQSYTQDLRSIHRAENTEEKVRKKYKNHEACSKSLGNRMQSRDEKVGSIS